MVSYIMQSFTYTGIGSRKTPPAILAYMIQLARHLRLHHSGHVYSGSAPGADSAFELGAKESGTYFLPYAGAFHRRNLDYYPQRKDIPSSCYMVRGEHPEARKIAERYYNGPPFVTLKPSAQALHTRNVCQILGSDCQTPVQFVVCYTPDGATQLSEFTPLSGGTRTAIRLAELYSIPVWNLQRIDHQHALEKQFDLNDGFHHDVANTLIYLNKHIDLYTNIFPTLHVPKPSYADLKM